MDKLAVARRIQCWATVQLFVACTYLRLRTYSKFARLATTSMCGFLFTKSIAANFTIYSIKKIFSLQGIVIVTQGGLQKQCEYCGP